MSQVNRDGVKAFDVSGSAALSEGYAVKLSAAGVVTLASAATDKIIGVTSADNSAGDKASVALRSAPGTFKCKAGGSITVGAYVTSDANGKFVATTTSGNEAVGIALEAAASGDLFEVMPLTRLIP